MVSCGHVTTIFLLGQQVCLLIEGSVELHDFLLVELGLFFEFVVVLGQELDVIFKVCLVNWLVVKQSVKFLELGFESDEFEIGLLIE